MLITLSHNESVAGQFINLSFMYKASSDYSTHARGLIWNIVRMSEIKLMTS